MPEIPFESVPNYFKYPAAMNLGEMAAVAVDSQGHVFMLSRSNTTGPVYNSIATQVFEFDQTGNYVREIGHNLYGFGYGIRVDKQDNIWVVDKGTDMVMEFNPEGHVIMVRVAIGSVQLDARHGLPVGRRFVFRRSQQLARAKANLASGKAAEIAGDNSVMSDAARPSVPGA